MHHTRECGDIGVKVLRELFGREKPRVKPVPAPYVGMMLVEAVSANYLFRDGRVYIQPAGSREVFCLQCSSEARKWAVNAIIVNENSVVERGTGFVYYCKKCDKDPADNLVIAEEEEPSS